jgi:pimeloyl-ACP methyl ester carboxylesterase
MFQRDFKSSARICAGTERLRDSKALIIFSNRLVTFLPFLISWVWSGAIQRAFSFEALPEREQTLIRQRSQGGEKQIGWLIEQTHNMAESSDDVHFTRETLHTVQARTLVVFGDSDPLYPVELASELRRAIPDSSLWIVPNGGHGPIFGSHAARFEETATAFLAGGSLR